MTNEAYKDELNAAAERGAAKRAKLNMHAPGDDTRCVHCGVREGLAHNLTCPTLKQQTAEAVEKARYKAAMVNMEHEERRIMEAALQPSPLQAMLDDRGSRYGKFVDHAACTQELKASIYRRLKDKKLMPDQIEALEMIAHKIGRIVCGDPDYEDSWRDIAGYATLVADRLKGEER